MAEDKLSREVRPLANVWARSRSSIRSCNATFSDVAAAAAVAAADAAVSAAAVAAASAVAAAVSAAAAAVSAGRSSSCLFLVEHEAF